MRRTLAAVAVAITLSRVASAEPFVHLEIGPVFQHISYRRVDDPLRIAGLAPPPVTHVDRTETGIGVGAPLRIDLGAHLRDGVVLALSGELAYVDFVSTNQVWGANGTLSFSLGVSTLWYPDPRGPTSARLGCAFERASFTGGSSDVATYDNTFDIETVSGVDCHVGFAWDFLRRGAFRLGPSFRLDGARMKNDRPNGASTYSTVALSITLGATFF